MTLWKCLIAPDSYDLFLTGLSEADKITAVATDFLDTWSTGSLGDLADAHFEDWGANPYTRGSYSSPGAGSYPDAGSNMREVAAEQIDTSLYFAGEATHNSPAVVVSAMESGERAALEIDADHVPVPEPQGWIQTATAI